MPNEEDFTEFPYRFPGIFQDLHHSAPPQPPSEAERTTRRSACSGLLGPEVVRRGMEQSAKFEMRLPQNSQCGDMF